MSPYGSRAPLLSLRGLFTDNNGGTVSPALLKYDQINSEREN